MRKQKRVAFVSVGDGSTVSPLQAVTSPENAASLSHGTAVRMAGNWKLSQGAGQSYELADAKVEVLGENDAETNPLQPKYQSPEFLRTIPHLRARIPQHALLLRLRSQLIAALTNFFAKEDFVQCHTPIITSSDCEGAGEVFTVSSNDSNESHRDGKDSEQGEQEHFFRTPKYLTVSAQLHLEALAQAVNRVWALSPTFRAEKSDTPRHLSEFYMLEAEMCFTNRLDDIMDVVENMLRASVRTVQESRVYDELLEVTDSQATNIAMKSDHIESRWDPITSTLAWPRITYTEAIHHLERAQALDNVAFHHKPTWSGGLQAEHERYLAASIGEGRPIFITHYPLAQKPFYMPPSSPHPDLLTATAPSPEGETAACFDLLVPDLCELVGGSLREHRLPELRAAMEAKGVKGEGLEWYQDLRRFGSVPHGGFGLGFDRLLAYLGGVGSVRDVVGFPRWYGRCDC